MPYALPVPSPPVPCRARLWGLKKCEKTHSCQPQPKENCIRASLPSVNPAAMYALDDHPGHSRNFPRRQPGLPPPGAESPPQRATRVLLLQLFCNRDDTAVAKFMLKKMSPASVPWHTASRGTFGLALRHPAPAAASSHLAFSDPHPNLNIECRMSYCKPVTLSLILGTPQRLRRRERHRAGVRRAGSGSSSPGAPPAHATGDVHARDEARCAR